MQKVLSVSSDSHYPQAASKKMHKPAGVNFAKANEQKPVDYWQDAQTKINVFVSDGFQHVSHEPGQVQ